jgi:hypothetical protein
MVAKPFFPLPTEIWMLIYLSGFIAFFLFFSGTVIWVFISEIFPNQCAPRTVMGCFTHWTAAHHFLLFPLVLKQWRRMGLYVFRPMVYIFYVGKFFPETKERTLEQIQRNFL